MATALSQSLAVQAIKLVPNGRFSTSSPRFERPVGRFPHRLRRSLILRASNETSSSAPSGGVGGATSVELLEPEHEEQLAEVARLLSVATSPSWSVGNGSGSADLRLGEAAAGELVRQLDTAGRAALLTALFPGCACSFCRRCTPLVSSFDPYASVLRDLSPSRRPIRGLVRTTPHTPHPIFVSGLIPVLLPWAATEKHDAAQQQAAGGGREPRRRACRPHCPTEKHDAAQEFQAADVNHDGALACPIGVSVPIPRSVARFRCHSCRFPFPLAATEKHDVTQEFQAADVNHDGVLDAREFATYVEAQNAKMAAADRPLNLHQLGLLATRSAIGATRPALRYRLDFVPLFRRVLLPLTSTSFSSPLPSSSLLPLPLPSHAAGNIGFGVTDNTIMLIAGDIIEGTLGAAFGISTLMAAGLGNAVSDIVGTVFREYIEGATGRFLPDVNFSSKQLADSRARWAETGGATVGVTIGCLMGLAPLLVLPQRSCRSGGEGGEAASAAGVPVPVATVAQVAYEEGFTAATAAFGTADEAVQVKIGDLSNTASAGASATAGAAFTQGATAHASISAAHWMGPSPSFRPPLAGAVGERGGLGVALLLTLSAFNVARRVRRVFMREGERRGAERVGYEESQT
ncbi:unnamed protein product [Closterium sp. NIES-54]